VSTLDVALKLGLPAGAVVPSAVLELGEDDRIPVGSPKRVSELAAQECLPAGEAQLPPARRATAVPSGAAVAAAAFTYVATLALAWLGSGASALPDPPLLVVELVSLAPPAEMADAPQLEAPPQQEQSATPPDAPAPAMALAEAALPIEEPRPPSALELPPPSDEAPAPAVTAEEPPPPMEEKEPPPRPRRKPASPPTELTGSSRPAAENPVPAPAQLEATQQVAAAPATRIEPSRIDADWQAALLRRLGRFQDYPRIARQQRLEGTVLLRLTVSRDGRIVGAQVVESSRAELLDSAALDIARRAATVPPLPASYPHDRAEVLVPILYRLDQR
jgi:protein TonB